jgi:hypothetical protein
MVKTGIVDHRWDGRMGEGVIKAKVWDWWLIIAVANIQLRDYGGHWISPIISLSQPENGFGKVKRYERMEIFSVCQRPRSKQNGGGIHSPKPFLFLILANNWRSKWRHHIQIHVSPFCPIVHRVVQLGFPSRREYEVRREEHLHRLIA